MTDPQVILSIEAREGSWFVAFARSTVKPLEVRLEGKPIWSCEKKGERSVLLEPFGRNGPFFISFDAERRSAEHPETILVKRPFTE